MGVVLLGSAIIAKGVLQHCCDDISNCTMARFPTVYCHFDAGTGRTLLQKTGFWDLSCRTDSLGHSNPWNFYAEIGKSSELMGILF